MFKKALQIAVTFSLLVGGYAGYARVFAVVAEQLGKDRGGDGSVPFPETESKSALKATELARASFGPEHWAASKDLKIRYYDAVRGYYMYAQHYERSVEGKQLKIWPFALVWMSKDGRSRKTAISDEAVIDLNQPFGLVKQGSEPSHVVHARMMGDVRLRDDKGTRDVPDDDLRVGPLTHLEYDEKTLQITTDSDIFLQDRDLTMTGTSMMIQLRRKAGAPANGGGMGFDAESAYVYKNVHIVIKDVGSSGILPGNNKPDKGGRTPLDLRCAGEMRIDLPRPRPAVEIGPPDLNREADPTLAKFKTDVRVLRGTKVPDQLNCDSLDLTLMPSPKPEGPAGVVVTPSGAPSMPAAGSGGPLTELGLRKALAQGHAVWLQSESQGMKARCIELKHDKSVEKGVPDRIYLNGGTSRKLWVEKVEYFTEGEKTGTIKSVMNLTALDATILDHGPGNMSEIIARGPGKTEERPARGASVERTAWWEDEMKLVTWRDTLAGSPAPPPTAPKGPLRRLITLTGVSKLVDHKTASTLDARKSIVAEFESGPPTQPGGGDGPSQIKWLQAFEDAHLTAPSRTLTARKQLDAKFLPPPPPPTPTPTPSPTGPIVAFVPPMQPQPSPEAKPDPAPAPVEPAVDARADRVWATIALGSSDAKGDLKDAQLRGSVTVHQDPAPGKAHGNEASGEALDLFGQGKGLMKFVVAAEPPQAANPRAKLASQGRPAAVAVLARVEFDGRTIEAPLIGLDQKIDFAWALGPGNLLQAADPGLLDDKGLARPGKPGAKDRLVITWTDEMKFFGRSKDLQDRPAAKAEFRGGSREVRTPDGHREFRRGVEAKMEDAAIYCDTMDVYMDRVIAFDKDLKGKPVARPGGDPAPAEPDAQIAMLDCRGQNLYEDGRLQYAGVDITSQKNYSGTSIVKEKQRIQHVHVIYDKRTGDFEAPGAGTTFLYKRKNGPVTATAPVPTVMPVAASGGRGRPDSMPDLRRYPPLELTKITFIEGMRGRFGVSKDGADDQTRHAEFVGSVQAANATVAQRNSDIDFDHPTSPDYLFLTSDVLHVFSQPPPSGSKSAARQLLNARGNAQARTLDRTIQADRVTFDSASELTYAYGDDGKEVVMIEQKSPGQPAQTLRGKAGRYNKSTREMRIEDPHAIQVFDLATGVRPKPFYPDTGGSPRAADPVKAKPFPLLRPGRNSTERNGFTGH